MTYHISYSSLCSETSTISLSTGTFSICFIVVMETTDLATRLSLVSCQKGAWRRAFFSEKLNFFQLEKTLRAAEKVLKSAQDFFENTTYSIGL